MKKIILIFFLFSLMLQSSSTYASWWWPFKDNKDQENIQKEKLINRENVDRNKMTKGQQVENELRNMRFKPREKVECEENMKKAGWCS